MASRIGSPGSRAWNGLLAVVLGAYPSVALAGDRHHPLTYYYVQSAPVATYAAPVGTQYLGAASTYSVPAQVYSAPAQVYSAPAQVYSAPAQVYSAPAQVYSTTAGSTYSAPGTTVGNAPVAGVRIKPLYRSAVIKDVRKEMKDKTDEETSSTERLKALRSSVVEKYTDALGEDVDELNEAEKQDVESIVNALVDLESSNGLVGSAPTALGYAPIQAQPFYQHAPTTMYQQAPVVYQQAPTMYLQPMAPVQILVPVQPKHSLFHR